ncbi:RNA-directed DNA polymerase from mobile element jockey [Trichonephila clavipes]|nr:RNA-directed DNA polymerase from mobile element jockey [Trichonephila clavipes]
MEFKIFVEKYAPDLILIQETHLRPKYNINIPNYICYRNDRDTGERARGGTLILIRRNFPHYNLPTPPLQHIEATIVVFTPPNFNPISIASVYVPPKSDERLFTLDFEQLLQTNSNCVIFGDLNATHNEWNCLVNSTRGKQLKTFTDTLNLTIAYPSSPTRFGHGTSNTLDIAVIHNFNFPFTMDSIPELSSDHNPVFLNFSLTSPIHQDNARAVTTCCSSGPACSDDQKANLLAITLKDNFTENERPNGDYPIDNTITTTLENFFLSPPPLPITPTDPDEVLNYIKTLSNNKAPGKDNITNKMKPGKNSKSPSSYRPISLLSILSKITEHIILNRLHNFTDSINYINPNQYGFTRHLSTYHPLLRLTEKITSGFQRGRSTGAVFLDIQKAFDRVWVSGLIYKLIINNFPPALIHLINSYLVNRSFQVKVNNTLSSTVFIKNGVTQGSLLGPILFNIYINDIPSHTLTMTNIYADDTSISATYKNHHTITKALNAHLILLEEFFNTWKIKINVDKIVAVLFTRRRKPCTPPTLYSTPLHWSQSTKYLGLVLEKNLTWKQHILHARDKFRNAMRSLYPLICRNSHLNIYNKVLLYTAVLRPILAYGCPVWGYAANSNIKLFR